MDDELERNQPAPAIPGGPRRESIRVDADQFPAVTDRERVEALLRVHDLDEARQAIAGLRPADLAIVRLVATEGAAAGAEPAVRYAAIAALAAHLSRQNLNLLADLAQFGEDFYVRGHALLALGQTGVLAHVPILASHLTSSEPFERTAAERGLLALAALSSSDAVHAYAALLDRKQRERITGALQRGVAGRRGGGVEAGETAAGDQAERPQSPSEDGPAED